MLKRTHIINYIAETLNLTDYLEIGLGDGLNFSSIICANKCGVDPNPGHFTLEGATIIPLISDEFFAKCKKTFDLIFLDGLHYADVLERDIKHALAALNPGGIIICHDVSPTSEDMQQVPRLRPEWAGYCWKAWLRVRREMPSMPMTVIDVDYGVGVIYPEGKAAYASVCIPPGDIGFESFATCKKEWLPTISADELPLFLGKANLPFPAYRQIKRATLNSAPRANRPDPYPPHLPMTHAPFSSADPPKKANFSRPVHQFSSLAPPPASSSQGETRSFVRMARNASTGSSNQSNDGHSLLFSASANSTASAIVLKPRVV
jgi:SAM-dependent methyltransferase